MQSLRNSIRRVGPVLVVIALVAGVASGDGVDMERGLECGGILSDVERLTCFDEWVRAMQTQPDSVDDSVAVGVEEAAPAADIAPKTETDSLDVEDEFGLPPVVQAEDLDKIESTIVSLDDSRQERLLITLSNEQVWRQTRGTTLRLDVGDNVAIERKLFGAFSLTKDGSSRSMRVKRVR